jgi:hypothetical protein
MPATLALDTRLTLLSAGITLLVALVLGVWKFREIQVTPEHRAHVYVDIAHRAALLYSFALTTIAALIEFSAWSVRAHLFALSVLVFFFWTAIGSYVVHGFLKDTENQAAGPDLGTRGYMIALIVGEIGATSFLLAGFVKAQF